MIDLSELRAAIAVRAVEFNCAHLRKTSDAWLKDIVSELGEFANLHKELEQERINTTDFRRRAGKELADIIMQVDNLALFWDIDLDAAVRDKFNEVSDRIGSGVKL